MEKAELAVILNSYNRLELLKKSITSLYEELSKTRLPFTTVIFDAGSTDGSIEYIKDFSSGRSCSINLIVVPPDSLSSFSYGVNTACEYAISHLPSLRYLFLYETDNFLLSGIPVIQAIALLKGQNEVAGCGFTVKKYNGTFTGFGSRFPSLISFILGQQFSFLLKADKTTPVYLEHEGTRYFYSDVVYTSPLLIKTDSWIKVKGFDHSNFPFSDCDIDLARRLKTSGERLTVLQTEDVIHDNMEITSSWSATRTIRFYRSRFTYFKKHIGKAVHLFKPFLFTTHIIEFILLVSLVILKKRKTGSLKTRWFLITHVFSDYK